MTGYFANMHQVTSIEAIVSDVSSSAPAAISTSILESASSLQAEPLSSTTAQASSSSLNDLLAQAATEVISAPSVSPSKGSLMVTKDSSNAAVSSSVSPSAEYTGLANVSIVSSGSQSSAVHPSSASHSVETSGAASQPVHYIGSPKNIKMKVLVLGLLGSTLLAFGL
ncbi:unnamed protein product [Ambrosiozyma monospora]|uniref:Unnamed protein product n=1 Tax=Ambrosiozyma monospora TaxID=43982 RepID=A0ACB5TEX6_AMBMO|nr:unnamed protein product [Ambrosiozyma monospora]